MLPWLVRSNPEPAEDVPPAAVAPKIVRKHPEAFEQLHIQVQEAAHALLFENVTPVFGFQTLNWRSSPPTSTWNLLEGIES